MVRKSAWQKLVGTKIRAAHRRGMKGRTAFRSGVAAAKRAYRGRKRGTHRRRTVRRKRTTRRR